MGPLLGGFLFGAGGYFLPFFVVGILCAAMGTWNFFVVPSTTPSLVVLSKRECLSLYGKRSIVINSIVTIILSGVFNFYNPVLALRLQVVAGTLQLTPYSMGGIFFGYTLAYALAGWISGWASDK